MEKMTLAFVLIFVSSVGFSQGLLENPGGSVTRMADQCAEVQMPNEGTLRACTTANGAGGRSSTYYELNGNPYEGLVIVENGGLKLIPKDEITSFTPEQTAGTSIVAQETPEVIHCGNPQRRTTYTSLVCNCFHEGRGESFAEQVMINRTVLSRVLSPSHPSTVRDVVYQDFAYQWTRIDVKGNPGLAVRDVVLDENSEAFKTHFPGETNSLRSCRRSALEALRYENEFFAVAYAVKGQGANYHRTCQSFAESRPHVKERNELINSDQSLAHNFLSVCEAREERCVMYPTCRMAPRQSPAPRLRPAQDDSGGLS